MIETRPSKIHGNGLFSKYDVKQGSHLGRMPRKTHGFNHGCQPNVELRPKPIRKSNRKMIDFEPFALRDIKADEELLTDYFRGEAIPVDFNMTCHCPAHKKS